MKRSCRSETRRLSSGLESYSVPAKPYMAFFQSAITTLQTLVIALGAGLCVWGDINLLEGYGNENPGANILMCHKVTQKATDSRHNSVKIDA